MSDIIAASGDDLLRFLADAKKLTPDLAKPGFQSFRVTTLTATVSPASGQVRVNPDYDFIVSRICAYVQPLAADTIVTSQHAYLNFRTSGRQGDWFDQNVCFAHFLLGSANGTTVSALGGQAGGIHFDTPLFLPHGSDVQATFYGETGLGASARIGDALIIGTHVHKDLNFLKYEGMTAADLTGLLRDLLAKIKT